MQNVPSDGSVSGWIDGLKKGDEQAASLLWNRYFDQLTRVAGRYLQTSVKRVADGEDVAVSVFKSLWDGFVSGRFERLNNRDELWRLLVTITRQKAVDQNRQHDRKKRGAGKVRGESHFGDPEGSNFCGGLDHLEGDSHDPQFLIMLQEQHARLLASLRDQTLRTVAVDRLEGYTNNEIAERLGISVRTVERKLSLIRKKWTHELEDYDRE